MVAQLKPKNKPTKIPPRRVVADDLVITGDDGQEYQPHAGEWVEVRGHVSVDDYLKTMAVRDIRIGGDAATRSEQVDELFDWLGSRILDWNWTNDEGIEMPKPTAAVIRGLDFVEIMWLLTAILPPTRSGEETKNDEAPSTSH